MDILQKLVRANALLLQGAHEGAEHVLDSAIVDVRELVAKADNAEQLQIRVGEMAAEIHRLNAEREQLLAQEPAIVVKGRKVVGFNPADGARIEGEFYAAPMPAQAVTAQKVKMPTNADEAAAMQMIGMAWLEQNAPERLQPSPEVAVPDCVEWSLTWLESALKCESFRWDGDQHEAAKYELEQARLWLSTRTTEPSTRITEQGVPRPDFDCNYIIKRSGYDDRAELGLGKMIGYVVIPIGEYEKLAPIELHEGVRGKLAEMLSERKLSNGPVWYPKNGKVKALSFEGLTTSNPMKRW